MRKRKFLNFSDMELDELEKALESYGNNEELIEQIKLERKEREYNRKIHGEWMEDRPKIYCC